MNGISRHRLLILSAILIALALLLTGQLVRWQILSHILFLQKVRSVQSRPEEIKPHRGMILDRNGHILAMETFTYEVDATPKLVSREDVDEVAARLAPRLPKSKEELREVLAGQDDYARLARDLSPKAARVVEELGVDNVYLIPSPHRFYPEGSLAGHLLGFVNAVGDGFGLEKYYHELLRGQPGQRFTGWDPLDVLRSVESKDGADLHLALNYLLQHQVELELARGVEEAEAEGGTVIVMDPRTGAVLAWASYPSYDPNRFSELFVTDRHRFVDPAISKQYEPGSVL
ncbi:MAG: penicillin-binding transpeptidase domain-containing protein, partial [Chloroflexota bacterium]|nr:penicillin-binding transpeptidase domain-containing protein [Chloroflexota bacterium]